MLRHGSLFSGIGGFDLAAEWMGWENVFHCERDPFGQRVLKHHFPKSNLHEDITTFEATQYRGRVDIITGGFPCQPFSAAGKRKGTQDDRHLWPEMLRVIREVSPTFVVGENVRGLLNWSGPNGEPNMVFNQVCLDLEAQGYQVAPLILPACGKNAPHRRDRIWFVASDPKVPRGEGQRFEGPRQVQPDGRGGKSMETTWEKFPTVPPVCGGDDGLPKELDGLTFSKWRRETIKAYGNAIVPQVAYEIFRAIQETYENS
jgi:DNA (cytosine-5)-methyltransferase 1